MQRSIASYIIRRLLTLIPVLLGVTLLTYGLMYLSPSDPVEMLLQAQGIPISAEVTEAMRRQLGLDRPFIVQYLTWLFGVLGGDMGVSYISGLPIGDLLAEALPRTLLLTLSSISVTILVSVPLGTLAAVRKNKLTDYIIRFLSFLANSLPGFLVSLLLLYFVALRLGRLQVLAAGTAEGLILPTLALAIPMTGKYIRQVRAAVLEELSKGYVRGAISRGNSLNTVIIFDVLRNALLSIITLMSLSIGSLLGGTAAVEKIFLWRGVGFLVTDAIIMRDYPMIQAFVVWISIIYIVINLATDILYFILDPRTRTGEGIA